MRLMNNNFISTIAAYSSQDASFPASNILTEYRADCWVPSGLFEITSSNQRLHYEYNGYTSYISLTTGNYSGTTLAVEIETKLDVVNSNFDCVYSSGFFTISLSSISGITSCSLKISTTTNSCWETIGFTGTSDLNLYADTDHSFTADVKRLHTSEYLTFDFGYSAPAGFIGIIGESDEEISLSTNAVVTIMANSINDFSSPAYTKALTRTIDGYFDFINESYRYWKIKIVDKENVGIINISKVYIGDYIEPSRCVFNGFSIGKNDSSIISKSESGIIYADIKKQYKSFTNISLNYIFPTDKTNIENIFRQNGIHTPLFVSIDPDLYVSSSLNESTAYVVFDSAPVFNHNVFSYYSTTLSFSEVL